MKTPPASGYIWENSDWPGYTHKPRDLASELAEAEAAVAETLALFRKLPVDLENEAYAELVAENASSTSRIEGEIFNPEEVRASAFHRLETPEGKKPKSSAGAEGVVAMLIDAVSDTGKPLTLAHLARWQRQVVVPRGGWKGAPGADAASALRTKKVFVVSHRGYEETIDYEAPPPGRGPSETKKFITWFNGAESAELPPLIRAGLAHLWFEALHPFADGNGRVGRALIDRTLAGAHGLDARALAVAPGILRERDAYYAALKAHNRIDGLDATPWLRWFLKNIAASAPVNRAILHHVQSKARFWIRHRATPMNDKQRKVVNRMADAGPAGFLGGMTNRKYVALTSVSDVTAYRDLADLVASGVLLPTGEGRSRAYTLNLPGV